MAKIPTSPKAAGIELYLKRIFALMFGAVGITAIASWLTLYAGGLNLLIDFAAGKFTPLYYIVIFGTWGFVLFVQSKIFNMKPATGGIMLAIYSALIGFGMTPLIWTSLNVNPIAILQAFVISTVMFGCMALFGYKTVKDLSFLGRFLFIGMIGLILVGAASFIWPLGGTFATIVCAIGVLVFALFTAYDMQMLKNIYPQITDETQRNQLAVLGALHMYISFIAMFQYVLSLLNRNN
jgi:FtsH-binding integral membrane protein